MRTNQHQKQWSPKTFNLPTEWDREMFYIEWWKCHNQIQCANMQPPVRPFILCCAWIEYAYTSTEWTWTHTHTRALWSISNVSVGALHTWRFSFFCAAQYCQSWIVQQLSLLNCTCQLPNNAHQLRLCRWERHYAIWQYDREHKHTMQQSNNNTIQYVRLL